MPTDHHIQDVAALPARFRSEVACARIVHSWRWPNGFICPRCANARSYRSRAQTHYRCTDCYYMCSLTAGTVFARSQALLGKWFLCAWLLGRSGHQIETAELGRHLNLCWAAANRMRRELSAALTSHALPPPLEAWLTSAAPLSGASRRPPVSKKRRRLSLRWASQGGSVS